MLKVYVDDKEIEVEDGSTVMQACEKKGVEIPRFCFHEIVYSRKLQDVSCCFRGSPKPVASCAMPAAEGMKIITNSESVKAAREGIMEFY